MSYAVTVIDSQEYPEDYQPPSTSFTIMYHICENQNINSILGISTAPKQCLSLATSPPLSRQADLSLRQGGKSVFGIFGFCALLHVIWHLSFV